MLFSWGITRYLTSLSPSLQYFKKNTSYFFNFSPSAELQSNLPPVHSEVHEKFLQDLAQKPRSSYFHWPTCSPLLPLSFLILAVQETPSAPLPTTITIRKACNEITCLRLYVCPSGPFVSRKRHGTDIVPVPTISFHPLSRGETAFNSCVPFVN